MMRVTNSMIANSARVHMSNAKNKLLTAEEQYTTEKKIQRPSDDPTIAVRALKYRGTIAQINQYLEKNVQDAMSWMDSTEGALTKINSILVDMKGNLTEGAVDYLAQDERNAVLSTLKQYVSGILEDNANADYAGRYLFTGYRTDTSFLFGEITKNFSYEITENFSYADVESINVVLGGPTYAVGTTAQDYVDQAASKESVYRMQLAYKNCSNSGLDNGKTPSGTKENYVKFTATDADGKPITTLNNKTVITRASTDTDAYLVKDDEIIYMYDTGEILLGATVYDTIQQQQADISIQYVKTEFEKQDIRPEMYFKCSCYDSVSDKTVNYSEPSGQDINYEVNFSQNMAVNTQGKDAISTAIYRVIDYLTQTVEAVDLVESKIADAEKMIENETDATKKEALTKLKETLETERSLRITVMTEAFGKGLTMVDNAQQTLNVAIAKLGTKYNRLQITYDKLYDQQLDTEEQLSDNEDMDIADAFINLTQADNLYQYSLSSTSKILGNTLLDYI